MTNYTKNIISDLTTIQKELLDEAMGLTPELFKTDFYKKAILELLLLAEAYGKGWVIGEVRGGDECENNFFELLIEDGNKILSKLTASLNIEKNFLEIGIENVATRLPEFSMNRQSKVF